MEPKGFHRKLAAILNTDVAGYSRLMQNDEAATVKTLEACKHDEPHGGYREIDARNHFGGLIVSDKLRKY